MSSPADQSLRPPAGADPQDKGSGSEVETEMDDDEEYEEIEEEVEVEEEVEEEVEVEEEEELCKDSPEAPIDEDRNNVSKGMESRGHEEQLRSVSSTAEKSLRELPLDSLAVEGSGGNVEFSGPSESREKEEAHVNKEDYRFPKIVKSPVASDNDGLREPTADKKDVVVLQEKNIFGDSGGTHYDSQSHLCNSDNFSAETTKPFSFSGRELTAGISAKDEGCQEDTGPVYSKEEFESMGMQSREAMSQRASRFDVDLIRPRSMSPTLEFKDGNKRPAIICNFFAQGWCVKGNSCRFLHIKDGVDSISKRPVGDVAAADQTNRLCANEGATGISRHPSFPDAATPSIAYKSSSDTQRILLRDAGESPMWHQSGDKQKIFSLSREDLSSGVSPDSGKLPFTKDNDRSISLLKDFGRESLGRNSCSDDYGKFASPIGRGSSPFNHKSLFPEQGSFSSSSVISSDAYRTTMVHSYAASLEEMTGKRDQYMLNDHSCPGLNHSLNSSSSIFLTTTGMFPSHNISSWARPSLSFSSSMSSGHLGSQWLSDSDRDYLPSRSSSLLQSSSPFSGSRSENVSLNNASGNPQYSAVNKTKISSTDWEPSIPFRPSFFITPQSISSSGSLYDPIRDSIEQPILGYSFSKFSSTSQGMSILSSNQQINGNLVLTGSLGADYSSDKHSNSSHLDHDLLHKNRHGKDLVTTEGETEETSVAEVPNKNTLLKEEFLSPSHVKDIRKSNQKDIDRGLQSVGPRSKKERKMCTEKGSSELDVGLMTVGDLHKESKALKHFRSALVDFVKHLVKPAWREGQLSKDAHKIIVRKAVDKVLSTVQSQQIPSTVDSVKQFLSSSRPKIAKLVEGYVEKYGKS